MPGVGRVFEGLAGVVEDLLDLGEAVEDIGRAEDQVLQVAIGVAMVSSERVIVTTTKVTMITSARPLQPRINGSRDRRGGCAGGYPGPPVGQDGAPYPGPTPGRADHCGAVHGAGREGKGPGR